MVANINKEPNSKGNISIISAVSNVLRRHFIIAWSVLILGLLGGSFFIGSSHAAADSSTCDPGTQFCNPNGYTPPGSNGYSCGVDNPGNGGSGDNQQAAGLVVSVQYRHWNGSSYDGPANDSSGNAQVNISTYHTMGSFPNGGIARMSANDNDELSLNSSVTFRQVPAACYGYYDVVLGYGKTSPNVGDGWSHWALDCEEQARSSAYKRDNTVYYHQDAGGNWLTDSGGSPDSAHYQPYLVTGAGNGANQIPNGAKPGGTWSSQMVSPHNGLTAYINLIYTDPKPPSPGPGSGGGQCTFADAINNSTYGGAPKRTHVHITGVASVSMQYTNSANQTAYYPNDSSQDIDEFVPDQNGENTNGHQTEKKWWYYPNANSIHVTITVEAWQLDDPSHPNTSTKSWHYINTIQDNGINCFTANCNNPLTIDGDGPQNIVLAGGVIHVNGSYTNTGLLTLWWPAMIGSDGGTYGVGQEQVPPGATVPFHFDMPAPGGVTTYGLSLTPAYYGSPPGAIGGACSAGVDVYQQFSSSLGASSDLKPTVEHPDQGDDYITSINVKNASSHNINIPTSSSFYKKSAGGGQSGIASNSGGTYASSPGGTSNTTLSGHYDIPGGSYQAGDEFCASIHANYTTGYVGPGNNVVGAANPADASSCPRIANEPYFKVYNSDISAGGAFDQCTTDGGLLAGYNDISDPAGASRGASSQLAAIALIKITGVASAQSSGSINRSPVGLTFANSGVPIDASGNESPTLGGNFGGCRTLTNVSVPASAKNLGSSSTGAVPAAGPGAYKRTGNVTINGGSLSPGQNVSLFVNGNVYIGSNISYSGGDWTGGKAPSFIVHATGNIYIDPSVTELSGLYIAQAKSSGTGGTIYTCSDTSNHFKPMSAANLYNGCKNQLVVYGSFVADQVNLMRSFGSLRDEEPNPGSPGTPAGTQTGLVWSSNGSVGTCQGLGGQHINDNCTPTNRCTQINEPLEPDYWTDNFLCVPSDSPLKLAWTHDANGKPNDLQGGVLGNQKCHGGSTELDCLKSNGYPYCMQWTPLGENKTQGWDDNWLCMNLARADGTPLLQAKFNDDPSQVCTSIKEASDPDGAWATTGYFLCEPKASAGTPPAGPSPKGPPFAACSNKASQLDNKACAGEIFEFSPALYLSNPVINPPGGGTLQFQSITSLPPVL